MSTKAMGPAKGWDWLMRAVNLGSQNPKALFGAAALLLLIALVPTVLQMLLVRGPSATNPAVVGAWVLFAILYSVLVMPPAIGGFLRVIHAVETGAPTRAAAIFDGYRQNPGRMIGLALSLMLIAIVVFGAIFAFLGTHFLQGLAEFMAAAQAVAPGSKPQLPALPDGFGTMIALFVLLGLFFNGVYALSFGQAALGGRGVGQALADGFAGTIKNLLPLLVLLVVAIIAGLIAGVVMALLMALLAVIGGFVHPAVAVALVAPVYIAVMLVVYVIAFGVIYYMWRDICGGDSPAPASPADQLQA